MNEWILTSDRLPDHERKPNGEVELYDVKFRNGKHSVATFDELDKEKPFCPWDNAKSRGKYYWHGYPKDVTVAWRIHDQSEEE